MNATVTMVGALLTFAGVLATAVVAFVGKRGENALTGLNNLTDQLQEERAAMKAELVEKTAALAVKDETLAALAAQRAADREELTRLRALVIRLGGDPA